MKKNNWKISLVVLLVLASLMILTGCEQSAVKDPAEVPKQDEEQLQTEISPEEEPGLKFPYELEDGKLEVSSVFQSDVPNPDKEFEESLGLASLELINKSDSYLEEAEITVIMENMKKFVFQVYDIPAGKTVWAFDLEGAVLESGENCIEI